MNVKKLISVATIMLTVGMIHAQGSNGLKIHYLGANHSLIQVKQPQKYLLLPVEETAPEATVNVLVNNKVEKSFQVRLAVNKVDYIVPFLLEPYRRLWLWTCIPVTVARMCAMLWTMPAGTT
jgi:fructan beta-fructosidase